MSSRVRINDGSAGERERMIQPARSKRDDEDEAAIARAAASPMAQKKRRARKALIGATIFCALFMVLEFAGGFYSHSLALVNDAAHQLIDVANLALSIIALQASGWKSSSKYTYGWKRAEVVGALASVFTVWAIVGYIIVEAVEKTIATIKCSRGDTGAGCEGIDAQVMLGIGAAGTVANAACALVLAWGGHAHSHGIAGVGGQCSHGHSHGGGGGAPAGTKYGSSDEDHAHSHGCGDHDHDHGHQHQHGHDHGHGECGGHCDEEHNHGDHGDHGDHGHGHGECSDHHDHHDHHDHNDHDDDGDHGHSHGHGHDDEDLNLRSGFVHMIADCIQSLGVVVAAGVIWGANTHFYGDAYHAGSLWNLADPVCSLIFAALMMWSTWKIFLDLFGILMQCVPSNVDHDALLRRLETIPGVVEVEDMHVWSLGSSGVVLTAHIVATDSASVIAKATQICRAAGITYSTVQVNAAQVGPGEERRCPCKTPAGW